MCDTHMCTQCKWMGVAVCVSSYHRNNKNIAKEKEWVSFENFEMFFVIPKTNKFQKKKMKIKHNTRKIIPFYGSEKREKRKKIIYTSSGHESVADVSLFSRE